jgi:hypothetical protein
MPSGQRPFSRCRDGYSRNVTERTRRQPTRRNDPNRRMHTVVAGLWLGGLDLWVDDDWQRLNRDDIAGWVESLAEAERSVRKLRKRLGELIDPEPTLCQMCDSPVFGRADARYCSAACRQKSYRQRVK